MPDTKSPDLGPLGVDEKRMVLFGEFDLAESEGLDPDQGADEARARVRKVA